MLRSAQPSQFSTHPIQYIDQGLEKEKNLEKSITFYWINSLDLFFHNLIPIG